MAVSAIATSTGKKTANAGSSSVPRPKPEKNVRPEARSATAQMRAYCAMHRAQMYWLIPNCTNHAPNG
jgi:hypothetical protein